MGMKKDNEKDLDILSSSIKTGEEKNVKKSEKALAKAEKQKAKAKAKRAKYEVQISELKSQIANESDENKKAKLVAKRDELMKQRDAVSSSHGASNSTKKAIRIVCIVVIVVALLATYFATGAVRNGLLAQFSIPQKTLTAATIVDKDGVKHPIKVSTYNFYFSSAYRNLKQTQMQLEQYSKENNINLGNAGVDVDFNEKFDNQTFEKEDGTKITWSEHLKEDVIEQIRTTYLYYYEALEANDGQEPEITADQQKEIDDFVKEITDSARKSGYNTNAYIKLLMGRGVNLETVKQEFKVTYIAENYKSDYMKNYVEEKYTEEELNAYKQEHIDELSTVDVRIFECKSEDDAKAFVKALKADGSNFNELASKYITDEFQKDSLIEEPEWTMNMAVSKASIKSMIDSKTRAPQYAIATPVEHEHKEGETHDDNEPGLYPGLDWLFSADRKSGEKYSYSTTVVYIVRPVGVLNTSGVDVRHILVNPVTSDDPNFDQTKATAEQWQTAYDHAKALLDEFNAGEKTAEAFGEIAKRESKDPGSAAKGGLYEDVLPGQMVPTFNSWCFDSSRNTGDVGIVKSVFGYHVMFFESKGDEPSWKLSAKAALGQNDSADVLKVIDDEYSINVNAFGELFLQKDTDMNV